MNVSLSTIRIVLVLVFFNQVSFGMKRSREMLLAVFPCFSNSPSGSFRDFSELPLEIQETIMKCSDDYANLQQVDRYWCGRKSIQTPDVFTEKFCNANKERMVRIILNAAYMKNYEGVENILKNSKILTNTQHRLPYHYIDTDGGKSVVLDLHGIARHNDDNQMSELLNKYNVPAFLAGQTVCNPTGLMMTCFMGDSQSIVSCLNIATKEMESVFKIVIDCDHGKCMNVLINNLYFDSSVIEMMLHSEKRKLLFTRALLMRACKGKRINTLKELLDTDYFYLNEIENDKTILDEILELATVNSEYNEVASLLEKYRAKTVADVEFDALEAQYAASLFNISGCTIF